MISVDQCCRWFVLVFPLFFHGGINRTVKWRFEEHNAMVRGLVAPERLLEWTVQDGWDPLCAFLDKPVPGEPFASGNTPPELMATIAEEMSERVRRANRNLAVIGVVLVALIAVLAVYVRPLVRF